MTWQCKDCSTQNPNGSDKCKTCQKHWKQVWHQGKVRQGSRPRPSRPRSKDRREKENADRRVTKTPLPQEDEPWQVFPAKVPWIATTPQSRIAPVAQTATQDEMEEDKPLPPQPILPVPPAPPTPTPAPSEVMTEAELELLKHLKGLQGLQELPETLAQQLQQLEAKQHSTLAQKSLSHGLLNKLHRARGQVQSLTKKIASVDEEWRQFLVSVKNKVHLHAQHYQQHRGDLVETLNAKLQELELLKNEVTTASQTLVEQTSTTETQIEDTDLQAQFLQFQQMTEAMGRIVTTPELVDIDLDEEENQDMEEEAEETEDDEHKKTNGPKPTKTHLTPAPFRTPGSPGKVAQMTLKGKAQGGKQAKEVPKSKERSATEYRADQ